MCVHVKSLDESSVHGYTKSLSYSCWQRWGIARRGRPLARIRTRSWNCEQHTAPRASFTCHRRNFSRVHVAQVLEPSSGQDRWIVVLASLKKSFHLIHVSPHLAWSTVVFTPFPTLAPCSSFSPPLLHPSVCPSTATLQGGLCFGRLAEQSPLTGYEPKSFIEVSNEHTPINLPSRGQSRHGPWRSRHHCRCVWSLRHKRNGTVDFTTVFSGARSKFCSIQCFLFSDSFKRGEIQAGRWAVFKLRETAVEG